MKTIILFILFFSEIAAAQFSCVGTVTYMGVDSGGNLNISLSSTPVHKVCSVEAQGTYALPVKTCGILYAALLSTKALGLNMMIYYDTDSYSCRTIPAWSAVPSAYYFQGPQ